MNVSPPRPQQRHLAGIAATVLVHAALLLAWQMSHSPLPPREEDDGPAVQWLRLPPPPALPSPAPAPAPAPAAAPAKPQGTAPAARQAAAPIPPVQASDDAPAASSVTEEPPAGPNAGSMVENARRSAGEIARALRKDAKPTIVLPPDSPQLRLQRGIEHAHAMAAPRAWEAPKIEELVNNTGDGARRTRVISGGGVYCITERPVSAGIDMIEKHGKQRITSCPRDEEPAKRQEWRTARD